jgi:hypothetical protein
MSDILSPHPFEQPAPKEGLLKELKAAHDLKLIEHYTNLPSMNYIRFTSKTKLKTIEAIKTHIEKKYNLTCEIKKYPGKLPTLLLYYYYGSSGNYPNYSKIKYCQT